MVMTYAFIKNSNLHITFSKVNRVMKIDRMQCFAGFSSKCSKLNKDRIYEVNQVTNVKRLSVNV